MPAREPPPHARPARTVLAAVMIVGAGALLAVIVGWGYLSGRARESSRRSVADLATTERAPTGTFIGSRACAECHPGETALHARSGHARTLRSAARIALARKLDGRVQADPEFPGVRWTYRLTDARLQIERTEGFSVERYLVDYAFGSGHHATTFVTVTDPDVPTAIEHRLTYYVQGDALLVTPGQRAAKPAEGATRSLRTLSPRDTLKCFGCHSTRTSDAGRRLLDARTMIPNVTCERCHGPAKAHVAAARSGRTDLTMPFGIDQWTADSQLRLCGQCHRHPSRAMAGVIRPDDPGLARFQPVGLSQSRCYTQSQGGLSCVSCHDPHGRASPDRASYEAVCLQCHQAAPQAVCSVSPRSGCLDCHMPRVDSGQHIPFTDHWIRVRSNAGPSPQPATSESHAAASLQFR